MQHYYNRQYRIFAFQLIRTPIFCFFFFSFFLAGCGQTTSRTSSTSTVSPSHTPTPSPTKVPDNSLAFQTIHLFDAQAGWAVTADGTRLLHTTQGVFQWQDVTPAFGSPTSLSQSVSFLDAATAWVLGDENPTLFIYRTRDGGATWQKAPLPEQGGAEGGRAFFLNAQVGWLVLGKGVAAGSEAVDVLHTVDGGATWKVISVASYTTTNQPEAIPFGGDKSGISFVNAETGWVTGSTAADHFVWLYTTHDGGTTWHHQDLPLPADVGEASTFPPVFFHTNDGVLPVVAFNGKSQISILYVTHDGGSSWSATTPVPVGLLSTTFVDAAHGWGVTNTERPPNSTYVNSTLYRTSDGGQHWAQLTVTLDASMVLLNFVSSTQGWALDSTKSLYATTNGGQTWTKVTATMGR